MSLVGRSVASPVYSAARSGSTVVPSVLFGGIVRFTVAQLGSTVVPSGLFGGIVHLFGRMLGFYCGPRLVVL